MQISNGATLEGTLFAPNADVSWQANQNIEGNVIAQQFTHAGGGSEVHDFAFNAELAVQPRARGIADGHRAD